MGVRFSANTDWISLTYGLGGPGYVNFGLGGWFRFDTFASQNLKVAFGLCHTSNGRALYCQTNDAFPDPQLYMGDSQTGVTGTPLSPRPTEDTWVYVEVSSPNTTGGTVTIRYSPLGSDTVYTATRTNGIEASVQAQVVNVNRGIFGDADGFTANLDCAYFRAYTGPTADDAAFLAHKAATSGSGTLFFWPLADNSDTSDTSGNGRTPTFNGTLESTDSPTLGGATPVAVFAHHMRMQGIA